MTRNLKICVLHLKSAVKDLNKKYTNLLQKFHEETPYDLCSSPKMDSEGFEYKVNEITTEIP
jgi:hypothetical protein